MRNITSDLHGEPQEPTIEDTRIFNPLQTAITATTMALLMSGQHALRSHFDEQEAQGLATCEQLSKGDVLQYPDSIDMPADKDEIIGECRKDFRIKIDDAFFDKSMAATTFSDN